MTTETHEFYVVQMDIDWGEEIAPGYWPDPNWGGGFARDLREAKRYTELGAERKAKKERMRYEEGTDIRILKVKAIYEFVEEEK